MCLGVEYIMLFHYETHKFLVTECAMCVHCIKIWPNSRNRAFFSLLIHFARSSFHLSHLIRYNQSGSWTFCHYYDNGIQAFRKVPKVEAEEEALAEPRLPLMWILPKQYMNVVRNILSEYIMLSETKYLLLSRLTRIAFSYSMSWILPFYIFWLLGAF